jgi:hypothetical protein
MRSGIESGSTSALAMVSSLLDGSPKGSGSGRRNIGPDDGQREQRSSSGMSSLMLRAVGTFIIPEIILCASVITVGMRRCTGEQQARF